MEDYSVKDWRSTLFGCPRLFSQYIRIYPAYLGSTSSIRNPRTRHAVVVSIHKTYILRGRNAELPAEVHMSSVIL